MRHAPIVVAVLVAAFSIAPPAMAFNGNNAATYADTYWNSRPNNYPAFSDDCTNFVSQSLHAGGIGFRTATFSWTGAYATTTYWVANEVTIEYWTTSWSVVTANEQFLTSLPGSVMTVVTATNMQNQPPSGYRQKGDVIYYDWDGNGTLDHASILTVVNGTDPNNSAETGSLIDEHITDRYHAIWHLWPYNSDRITTDYFPLAISSSAS